MNFFTLATRSLPGLLLACALHAAPASAQITLTPVTPPTTPSATTPRTLPDPAPRADLPSGPGRAGCGG
ncbi:hypothetical protein, partial [Deinococcus sp. RIT780]|uniref:hypothetical protein n=1 Tax=Deinococcus sp. RIT780 TaxID=2870472 RepID=UPI001C8AE0AA